MEVRKMSDELYFTGIVVYGLDFNIIAFSHVMYVDGAKYNYLIPDGEFEFVQIDKFVEYNEIFNEFKKWKLTR